MLTTTTLIITVSVENFEGLKFFGVLIVAQKLNFEVFVHIQKCTRVIGHGKLRKNLMNA